MKKMFGGGIVAGVLAALLFMGGMVAAGALGGPEDREPTGGAVTPAAIGPRISESNYVGVTPCRVFDTRKVAAGAHENEVRHYDARGSLSAQGGAAAGCAIPAHANSIVITITGVTPTGKGFMRGKAFDGSNVLPQATLLNYAPGIDASNTLTLPIAQGLSKEFSLGTFGNRVHLVGDTVGYFADAQYAVVDGSSSPSFLAENRFVSVTRNSVGRYTLIAEGDVRGCAVLATPGISDNSFGGNPEYDARIDSIDLSGSDTSIEVEVIKSSTDALSDVWNFTVLVQC